MTMAKGISRQGMKNREFVSKLLREKQPRIFSGARAGDEPGTTGAKVTGDPARHQRFRGLVTSNVTSLGTVTDPAQAIVGRVRFIQSAGVHGDETGSYPSRRFARAFATADGAR